MKKILMITGCAAFLCIIITSMTGVSAENNNSYLTQVSEASQQSEVTQIYYMLKEYDKRVAAFSSDSKTPFFVSGVYVSELPKADRLLLKEGIRVENKKELERLLEDYCS